MHSTLTDHELSELSAELAALRNGHGQITIDPIHAGQPIVEVYSYSEGESTYWLQHTHQNLPVFSCCVCGQVSLGKPDGPGKAARPPGCGKCGTDHADDLTPHLYDEPAACRAWSTNYGGQYDGPCLIAGSAGCECPEGDG